MNDEHVIETFLVKKRKREAMEHFATGLSLTLA